MPIMFDEYHTQWDAINSNFHTNQLQSSDSGSDSQRVLFLKIKGEMFNGLQFVMEIGLYLFFIKSLPEMMDFHNKYAMIAWEVCWT